MVTYVVTGGGSAGHAIPSLRVAASLKRSGHKVIFIGSENSIEKTLSQDNGVEFISVSTAKYDRSKKHLLPISIFKNLIGIIQSIWVLKRIGVKGVFSSGGFVSIPVIIAAKILMTKSIVVHASDISLGLANSICKPFSTYITCTFAVTAKNIRKGVFVGPIVPHTDHKPLIQKSSKIKQLLIYGGSIGSQAINNKIRSNINILTQKYIVHHVCGKKNTDSTFDNINGYHQYEYVNNLSTLISSTDIAICRAGSGSLWELIIARTPHLAVPLPLSVSRGDQLQNCKYFESLGTTFYLEQHKFSNCNLDRTLAQILEKSIGYKAAMDKIVPNFNAVEKITELLLEKQR